MIEYPFLRKLLYGTILVNYLIIVLVIAFKGTGYWYDEIIVNDISKQPIGILLEVIKHEPHPPGFYILLKALGTHSREITRIIITSISFAILGLSIYWADRKAIIEKYNLSIGLMLWVSSYLWLSNATNLKQDSVTNPLLLFAFFIVVDLINNKSLKSLLALALITLINLLFGYLNFFRTFILFLTGVILYKCKKGYYLLTVLCFLLASYLMLFGWVQYKNNRTRFEWLESNRTSMVGNIFYSLSARQTENNYAGDLFFIGCIFLIATFALNGKTKFESKFAITTVIILGVYVFFPLMVRNRYIVDLIFAIVVLASWGLCKILRNVPQPKLILKIVFIVCITNNFLNISSANSEYLFYKQVNTKIGTLIGNKNTGIVTHHPNESYIRKLEYFNNMASASPINVYEGPLLTTPVKITTKILDLENIWSERDTQDIRLTFAQANLNRYIYVMSSVTVWAPEKWAYDPNMISFNVLNQYCNKKDLSYINSYFFVIFDDCNF